MGCQRVYCGYTFEFGSIKQLGGARFAVATELMMNIKYEGMWRCIGWQMTFRRGVFSPSSVSNNQRIPDPEDGGSKLLRNVCNYLQFAWCHTTKQAWLFTLEVLHESAQSRGVMLTAFALYLGGRGYEYHFGDRPLVFFVGFLSHRRYLPRQYRKRVLQLGSKLLQSCHA